MENWWPANLFPSPTGRRWREATDEGRRIQTHGKLQFKLNASALIRPTGTFSRGEKENLYQARASANARNRSESSNSM